MSGHRLEKLIWIYVVMGKKQTIKNQKSTSMDTSDCTREIFSPQEMRWLVVEKFEHKGTSYYYSPTVLGGEIDDGNVLYDTGIDECDFTHPSHSIVGVWDDSLKKVIDYATYMASYRSYMANILSCK